MKLGQNKTLFISDLHLDARHPEIADDFIRLVKDSLGHIDALYILGDFFESWIGDDDLSDFHQQIIHTLKFATQTGLPIYFMHGNRDFLIRKKFLAATGCQYLPDETVINLYGTPVLLMHGDTLCTLDVSYLKTRKKMRNPILQKLFLLLPLSLRRKIRDKIRASSQQHIQSAASEIMDVTQEAVFSVMQKHHVQYLIHGHTHRPATHSFMLHQKSAERIVLAAWDEGAHALIWQADGKKELVDD